MDFMTPRLCLLAWLFTLVTLPACSIAPAEKPETESVPAAAAASLTGVVWKLAEIRIGGGARVAPHGGASYTLEFGAGGDLAVEADCNRGQGAWSSSAPGRLAFDRLAVTLAVCPLGSLHDAYLHELDEVRSYAIQQGELLLTTSGERTVLRFEASSG
jgi:heat shock protein HslJ